MEKQNMNWRFIDLMSLYCANFDNGFSIEGDDNYSVSHFFNTKNDLIFLNKVLNKDVVIARLMRLIDIKRIIENQSVWVGVAFVKKDYRFFLIDDFAEDDNEVCFDGMNFSKGKVNLPVVSGKPDEFIIVVFPIDYYNKIEKQDNDDDLKWLLED